MTDGFEPQGTVEPGFEPVVDEFVKNFEERGDLGAAVAVYAGGRKVVDLWGGVRDRQTFDPWTGDTRSVIFSTSKGLLAICIGILVDRGVVDLDAPVATYWPEFEAQDKGRITVRMVLNHTAGLPTVDTSLTRAEVLAWTPVTEALAAQAPMWEAGTGIGYHSVTIGFLAGEIVRRVTGVPVDEFFQTEVAQPLGVETSFGIGATDDSFVARTEPPLPTTDPAAAEMLAEAIETRPFFVRGLTIDGALPFPGMGGDDTYNSDDVRRAVLPAVNGFSTARDLARIYAGCVGEVDGTRLLPPGVVADMTVATDESGIIDPGPIALWKWATGFIVSPHIVRPMFGTGSFGHDGADGSIAFGNTQLGASFAYTTNQMGGLPDVRANRLSEVVGAILSE